VEAASPTFFNGRLMRDSFRPILLKKSDFLDRLNSGTTISGKPTHHIEWFFGSSLTFVALLLG
jgi:hypothetical protein